MRTPLFFIAMAIFDVFGRIAEMPKGLIIALTFSCALFLVMDMFELSIKGEREGGEVTNEQYYGKPRGF